MNPPAAGSRRSSLDALVPQASRMIAHPVYLSEMRHLRRGRSLEGLVAYSLRQMMLVCLLAVIVWALFVWHQYQSVNTNVYTYGWGARRASENLIVWLGFIGWAGVLLLDFIAMMAAVRSVNADRDRRRWDLVRLTPLGRRDIITAKHTVAQMRCWWFTITLTSLRVAAILLFLLQFGALATGMPPRTAFARWLDDLPVNTLDHLLELALLLLALGFFVVDPLLRLRLFSALGLAISARVRSASLAVLAGLASLAALWLMQLVAVGLAWALLMALLDTDPGIALALVLVIIMVGVTLGYYTLLRQSFLGQAARDAFRD